MLLKSSSDNTENQEDNEDEKKGIPNLKMNWH